MKIKSSILALQHKGQLKRIELALLLLLFVISLICFSPKKLDPLAAIAQMSAYHVTLALGFEYKNIYPNYSATAGQKLVNLAAQNSPAELFRIDLKKALPAELWETKNHFLYPLAGFEPGIVLAIRYLWHLTNNYSLGTIYWALKFLSLLGALAIFFLVATLRLPLLSLLAGTFFLFSPPLNDAIQFCSIYSFAPIVAALTTYLVFAACNNSEKKLYLTARILLVVLASLLLTGGGLIRSTTTYLLIPLTIVILIQWLRTHQQSVLLVLVIFLSSFFTFHTLNNHFVWNKFPATENFKKGHEFWHPIWCGLGEFENPYGFAWKDTSALNYALHVDPKLPEKSLIEYEAILKKRVITVIQHDPLWLFSVIFKRLYSIASKWVQFFPGGSIFIPYGSLILSLMMVFGFWSQGIRKKNIDLILLLLPFLFDLATPILVYSSYVFYNLTAYLGLTLKLLCLTSNLLWGKEG